LRSAKPADEFSFWQLDEAHAGDPSPERSDGGASKVEARIKVGAITKSRHPRYETLGNGSYDPVVPCAPTLAGTFNFNFRKIPAKALNNVSHPLSSSSTDFSKDAHAPYLL
jgi:hypothetical protein